MQTIARILTVGGALLALAACGTTDRSMEISGMANQGDAFAKSLQPGYVALGKAEYAEYDFRDAGHFFDKGAAAAAGGAVAPDEIGSRMLPEDKVGELSAARQRLSDALGAGATAKIPSAAARAQVMFDCWMQEQEENHQPKHIEKCRADFEVAMKAVEAALKPKAMAKAAPKPMPAPASKPIVDGLYLVHFDFNDARPGMKSGKVIMQILADYDVDKPARITLTGHTDRSGKNSYNDALALKRAENIKALLTEAGIPADSMAVSSFGEDRPVRATKDGECEGRNRRVEVEFE